MVIDCRLTAFAALTAQGCCAPLSVIMPVRFGYFSISLCIIGLLGSPCRGAEGPSAGLRQQLVELLRPEFEVFAWSPVFFPSVGLVYDNRPEPCSLEIAALQKRIAVAPDDFGGRFRLGWLMNQHGTPGSGTAAMADALKACRERLKEKADEERALIDLALMMAGTDEAEKAARKAVDLYPKSWRCWDALARHQLRKMEQRLLGNLPTTPQELAAADYSRLQSALKAHAADPDLLAAMFALNDEREASAKQAITLAPAEAEAHFDYAEARATAGVIVPPLHRLNNETISEKDADAYDRETLRAIDRAVVLAKTNPNSRRRWVSCRFKRAPRLPPRQQRDWPSRSPKMLRRARRRHRRDSMNVRCPC
jgi:hypothetical protein